ncbi:hypothetical protein KCP77_17610 [Salmonella enterica subsp. enterica]|nr:hypothetical protein KCP77_17610 [Salmonella enterica subsp. enterica]
MLPNAVVVTSQINRWRTFAFYAQRRYCAVGDWEAASTRKGCGGWRYRTSGVMRTGNWLLSGFTGTFVLADSDEVTSYQLNRKLVGVRGLFGYWLF